nr:MAG: hypothetical protein KatS3mg041_0094 [Bacteroidota bacterium]
MDRQFPAIPDSFWDRPVVLLDCESTGTDPRRDRIIELALWRREPDGGQQRFSSLVNPETWVPRTIVALTGIRNEELLEAPRFCDLWPQLGPLLEGAVLVGHNVRFDVRLLQAELLRMGLRWHPQDTLCTLRVARRLLPRLPSRSLGALAEYLGLDVAVRHRALADVELLSQVFAFLLDRARRQEGIRSLEELLRWQYSTRYLRRELEHVRRLEPLLEALPEGPGLYRFYDASGRLLYVGKSVSLRQRVRSYFAAPDSRPARLQRLLDRLRSLSWQQTRSELEALLLEAWEIARHRPPFNRQGVREARGFYLRISPSDQGPCVHWAFREDPEDGGQYYGPFRRRQWASLLARLLEDHLGALPQADRCREARRLFSSGGVLELVRARMLQAAEAEDFEAAIVWRELWKELDRLWQGIGAGSLEQYNVLGRERCADGLCVWLLRSGRWMGLRPLPEGLSPKELAEELERWWGEDPVFDRPEMGPQPRSWPIQERRILLSWLAYRARPGEIMRLGAVPDWQRAARWVLEGGSFPPSPLPYSDPNP